MQDVKLKLILENISERSMCVIIENELYIKRYERVPMAGIRLISDNERYVSFEVPKDRLEELNIIGVLRAHMMIEDMTHMC
ncbi:hypothetical protein BKH43_07605 [Helicobacter sp. 13S00401-1]|uniref:S24 family peptidase n=1 Tax=Helicobacter sp. 13S00401-1 TaxID=1905758 RepID=UPI000BA51222|nr:S24 family peptidase [Helicobacter sp. 13S00401-1]PAF49001.1 hypothetical protein BKH43_07605 [Helicobacter sp. 13S00401-1]